MPSATDSRLDPAAFPAEAGRVWLNRILLEERLSGDGSSERWRVVDRRTGAVHCLELLPADRITRLSDADRQSLVEPFIHASIPGLLSHCRLEGAWPHYAALSRFDPRLSGPSLASPETQIPSDPAQALQRFFAIAQIIAQVHGQGLRAHAALTPDCLWLPAAGEPLLAGYPYSIWSTPEPGSLFLSPQRRQGAAPDPSDDVYGLGALASFLLTGGAPVSANPARIDDVRQQRRLPTTGWPKGWDDAVLAALGGLPSLRPASVRALMERLSQATQVPLPAGSSPEAAALAPAEPRRRRPPSWRVAKRPHLSSSSSAPPVPSTGDPATPEPRVSWAQVRQQQAELDLQRADVERRARLLAEDVTRAAERKAELARLDAELDRNQEEYNQARIALDAALASHESAKAALQAERKALESERQRLQSEEAATRTAWEARKKSLDTQQAANEARLAELKRRESDLAQRDADQARREEALTDGAARLQKEKLAWIEEQAEAERTRREASATAVPTAEGERAPSTPPTESGVNEEARLLLAKLDAVEAERDRLEREFSALKARQTEVSSTQTKLDELTAALKQRDEELARQSDQLRVWKETQEREQAGLVEARHTVDRERTELRTARERLEQEQTAWKEEVRRKAAEAEVAEKARKKSAKSSPPVKVAEPVVPAGSAPAASPAAPSRSKGVLVVGAVGAVVAVLLGILWNRASSEAARLREAAAAARAPTTLVVVTDPLGAEVSLAGKPAQPSPARFEQLTAGPIQIRVTKEGYRPQERTFELREGQTLVSEPVVLNPLAPAAGPTGWLYVRTRPMGAQVSRIGAAPVASPALLPGLPAGSTRISVRLEGYLPVERTVDIKAGEDSVLDLTLQPAPPPRTTGSLRVSTEPAGAEVRIAGQPAQTSPARFDGLTPGTVRITVTKEGFEPLEQSVEVRPGDPTVVPALVLKARPVPTAVPRVATPPLTLPKSLTLPGAGGALTLQRVEAGEVNLGDAERGRVRVRVTRPFLMAEGEVTQAAFAALMGENPSVLKERKVQGPSRTIMEDVTTTVMSGGRPTAVTQKRPKVIPGEETITPLSENPVENVTWDQAVEFCLRLTRAATAAGVLPAGTVVRLPTEAEWELAQRRGADWSGGDARGALDKFAWSNDVAANGHQSVRTKQANTFGLFDLDGNVAEWCLDAWSLNLPAENAADPVVLDAAQLARLGSPAPGSYTVQRVGDAFSRRVVRGGSWRTPASVLLNQPVRTSQPAKADDIGFRVVVAAPLAEAPAP